jgi:hypothetical protein
MVEVFVDYAVDCSGKPPGTSVGVRVLVDLFEQLDDLRSEDIPDADSDVASVGRLARRGPLGPEAEVEEAGDLGGAHLGEAAVTAHELLESGAARPLDGTGHLSVAFQHGRHLLEAALTPPLLGLGVSDATCCCQEKRLE